MDHVVGRGDDADLLPHRHHQGVVHLQQVVRWRIRHIAAVGHGAVAAVERGDEGQPLTFPLEVVVAPLPLVTRGLDGEVCVGRVLLRHQHLGGRQGHRDHDDEGNHRPHHFHGDRLMEVGRFGALRLAVFPDGIEHHRKDANENHRADDEHHPVQEMLLLCDARHRRMQVELIDGRAARQIGHGMRHAPHPGGSQPQHRGQLAGNALHGSHLFQPHKSKRPATPARH